MILPIVGSFIYSTKRRTAMQLISPSIRDLWKEWDLRVMVLLSLLLQMILIALGHRRKYKQSLLIRAVVWSAYLAADSTAIFALGLVCNNLMDIYYKQDKPLPLDANTLLTAFWAPFLLLHLGGPDNITAYSLEDNELWLRHLAGLFVQTIITIYVLILTWTESWLSVLFIPMFFAGFIKYGERNYTLRSASYDKLRESLFTRAQFFPLREKSDLEAFGQSPYRSRPQVSKETPPTSNESASTSDDELQYEASGHGRQSRPQVSKDTPPTSNESVSTSDDELQYLHIASSSLDVTKRLFLDIILSDAERDRFKSDFRKIDCEKAFDVVETEIGLIYDLLYTKAPALCTPWGLSLRGITFFLICIVLAVFTIVVRAVDNKERYSMIDVSITFLLLIVAVIVDVYSALLLLFSDQFNIWLISKQKITLRKYLRALTSFRLSKKKTKRWSHQMSHWSLLSSSISEKPLPCRALRKIPKVGKKLDKQWHAAFEVPREIKKLIFDTINKIGSINELHTEISLGKEYPNLIPGLDQFGNRILFWHIVTEVSYALDEAQLGPQSQSGILSEMQWPDIDVPWDLTKHISGYMAYLLVKYPSLLSVGADKIALHKIIDQAFDEFQRLAEECSTDQVKEHGPGQKKWHKKGVVQTLVKNTLAERLEGYVDSPKGLFYGAVEFADFIKEEDLSVKWKQLGSIWLQMLLVAAIRSEGKEHAQQLRRGGEFFTHVWLLMAHFGLNSRFQIVELPYRDQLDGHVDEERI